MSFAEKLRETAKAPQIVVPEIPGCLDFGLGGDIRYLRTVQKSRASCSRSMIAYGI